jgi:DNA invertase Pin-like site-specific DNA recombinase
VRLDPVSANHALAHLTKYEYTAILTGEGKRKREVRDVKQAAAYIRVSTVGQAEHGTGLAEQREAIERYCEEKGIDLVAVYEDAGVSGANGIDDREALPELLADLNEGQFDGVVIVRLDRLARDLMKQETIINHLRDLGAEVASLTEPDLCAQDPSRKLIRQIMGAVAEYEKDLIVARLAAGRRRKRKTDGGYSGGFVPYGYQVEGEGEDAHLTEKPEEAQAVRRIFIDYLAGASMRDLADALEADGIKTKRGGRWASATLGNILANEAYTGATGAPAIIDEDLFDAAQDKRRSRRRN